MAVPTKKYRLKTGVGKHFVPNPDFKAEDEGADSSNPRQYEAPPGSIVDLTDDQFRAFHNKFEPVEVAATDVRDGEAQKLEDAKVIAASTGQNVNPNAPMPPLPRNAPEGPRTISGKG